MAVSAPGCTDDPAWDDEEPHGCGTIGAYIYFYSFTLIVTYILLNVFIAVILEGFGDLSAEAGLQLTRRELNDFVATWVQFDHDATMFISSGQLPLFVQSLPSPLNLGTPSMKQSDLLKLVGKPSVLIVQNASVANRFSCVIAGLSHHEHSNLRG